MRQSIAHVALVVRDYDEAIAGGTSFSTPRISRTIGNEAHQVGGYVGES